MTETNKPPNDSAKSKADAIALAAEAEAEAAEAEALAAAARARAHAARLKRAALDMADIDSEEASEGLDVPEDSNVPEGWDGVEAWADYDDESEDWDGTEDWAEEWAEAEEAAGEYTATAPSWRRWVRMPKLSTIAKAAAILIICGFTGFSGYMVWQHQETTERQERAAKFAAGAKQGVVNMISLDFNRAKEDVQRVIDSSTGEFRDDFQQRADDFTKVVEQSKVVTEGAVNATAVESIDGRSALVLVSATSRVTNSAGANDEPRAWRLKVTVTEEDGEYKMSKVEFVP